MNPGLTHKARLIVNADDFGYFDEVSRGILDAAEHGTVTAIGVMANGPALQRWLRRLRSLPFASVGVHLNATLGEPLTDEMRQELRAFGGHFPRPRGLITSLMRGSIRMQTLLREWRRQIAHCIESGLNVLFVNSHEHVHMLPGLYQRVSELAREFGITHVRAPRPEWGGKRASGGITRGAAFSVLQTLLPSPRSPQPLLIGVSSSGRLCLKYCEWRFQRLRRGETYELMCHPGWNDPAARVFPELAAYHDWQTELQTLLSPEFMQLLEKKRIALVGFSDLKG